MNVNFNEATAQGRWQEKKASGPLSIRLLFVTFWDGTCHSLSPVKGNRYPSSHPLKIITNNINGNSNKHKKHKKHGKNNEETTANDDPTADISRLN